MPRQPYFRVLFGLIVLGLRFEAHADSSDDYLHRVKPILERRCYSCHGALKQQAKLRLDTGNAIQTGGESGLVVVAGDAAASVLVQRIRAADESERMPPEGAPLTTGEVRIISDWVTAGASFPDDEKSPEDPRSHWAFRAPVRPALPNASRPAAAASTNPIDLFINSELDSHGLQPVPEADRATLLRRVYLDLIGLPPTRDDLREFIADTSPAAYETVVERLLQSPAYGERWGRHWMDIWRYSDWYGRRSVPDVMNSYPQIWRWRDWIVRSLNEDKGYDLMVQQMLAADELCPGDDANVVATGFLVRNWFKWNYENWMKDNVEHTAKAFLGLTLNCAHCHDHKYDPLTQEDYFHFRAFFEPLELRQDRVAGLPDPGSFKKYVYGQAYGPIEAGLIRVFDEKLAAQTFMYIKGDARNRMPGKPAMEPAIPKLFDEGGFTVNEVHLPAAAYYPGLKPEIRQEEEAKLAAELAIAERDLAAAIARLEGVQTVHLQLQCGAAVSLLAKTCILTSLTIVHNAAHDAERAVHVAKCSLGVGRAKSDSLQARIAADDAKYFANGDGNVLAKAASTSERNLVYQEALLRQAKAEVSLAAADPSVATAYDNAKQVVAAARQSVNDAQAALATVAEAYTPLSPVYPATSTGRRTSLARWITSTGNPLAARVAVNHIWLRHFGRGLVDTPNNFGRSGHKPSHPQLLDWLAVELMDNGWRMKPLHRLIVTSAAYRRRSSSNGDTAPKFASDPDNRDYWRTNTRRMEAEVVRDSVLACAGELDRTLGGPELDAALGLSSPRRSLYFASHGEGKMQFLDLFDAPDVGDCYQRQDSVRPQQALALANNDLALDLSRKLAAKLYASGGTPSHEANRDAQFITAAFETILSRAPTDAERQLASGFLAQQVEILKSTPPAQLAVKLPPAQQPPATDFKQRARELLVHALYNHNDFVTIR